MDQAVNIRRPQHLLGTQRKLAQVFVRTLIVAITFIDFDPATFASLRRRGEDVRSPWTCVSD
jgi:hypothetical protein